MRRRHHHIPIHYSEDGMKRLIVALVALLFSALAFAAVNINTATKEELDALKGIGPVKAQAIIDYRTKNGPFKSVDDIKNVKGIGDKTFDEIKGDISTSGTTVVPAAKKEEKKAVEAKPSEPKKTEAKPAAAPAPAPAAAPAPEPKKAEKAMKDDGKKAEPMAKEDKKAADKKAKEEKKAAEKKAKEDKKAADKKAKDEKKAAAKQAKEDKKSKDDKDSKPSKKDKKDKKSDKTDKTDDKK
jgi:competence protein ComEA